MTSNKRKKWITLLLIAIIYCIIEVVSCILRGISFQLSSIVMFIFYSTFTYFLCKRFSSIKTWQILISSIIGFISINLVTIADFPLPGDVDAFFRLCGIFVGFLLFKTNKYSRWGIITIAFLFIFCIPRIWGYYLNYLMYGTCKENINITLPDPFVLTNEMDTLNLAKLRNKIHVIDFWNSTCGVCRKSFPDFQQLADKYKHEPRVSFYVVNADRKEPSTSTLTIPSRYNCKLPSFAYRDNTTLSQIQINVVPTYIIISQKGNIIYRGSLQNIEKNIKQLLREKS